MKSPELELKALMLASQRGDAAAHRALLDRLSRHLRGYYKRPGAGRAPRKRRTWCRKHLGASICLIGAAVILWGPRG